MIKSKVNILCNLFVKYSLLRWFLWFIVEVYCFGVVICINCYIVKGGFIYLKMFVDFFFFDWFNLYFEIDWYWCVVNFGVFVVVIYYVIDFDRFFKSDIGNRNSYDVFIGDFFSENIVC